MLTKLIIRSHTMMSVSMNENEGDSRGPCIELDDPAGSFTVWVAKDA